MTTRAKAIITTGIVVPIVAALRAAVAGGVAGRAYDSLLAWLAPDHVSGCYVMLDANNGPTETGNPLLEDGPTLQSHGGDFGRGSTRREVVELPRLSEKRLYRPGLSRDDQPMG
jgi:hypothetical protein